MKNLDTPNDKRTTKRFNLTFLIRNPKCDNKYSTKEISKRHIESATFLFKFK